MLPNPYQLAQKHKYRENTVKSINFNVVDETDMILGSQGCLVQLKAICTIVPPNHRVLAQNHTSRAIQLIDQDVFETTDMGLGFEIVANLFRLIENFPKV